ETIPKQQYEKPHLKFGVSTILSLDTISKNQSSLNSEKTQPPTDCQHGHVQDSHTQDLRSTLITQACHPYSQHPVTQYPHYVTHGTYVHSNPVAPILPTWYQGAVRGRGRRGMLRRAVFSDNQRKALEKKFQLQKYIGKPDRKKLALKLGLKDSQVKIWFQNRRMKWRNSQERQMISSSLSTENNKVQVLPIPKCVRE
uniref:Homeobox domain-containing protein n=2 Tax=Ciona intestinalis TaxID=7719 RepID=F6W366_CIOIN